MEKETRHVVRISPNWVKMEKLGNAGAISRRDVYDININTACREYLIVMDTGGCVPLTVNEKLVWEIESKW